MANYASLSPLSFLPKAAAIYPDRVAIIHGAWRSTWAETYARCRRLASALAKHGVGAGDTVAVMAPNVPAIYEAHFGVPMTGAVLNTLNIRLDAEAIAFQLTHGEAKVLITDREFSAVVKRALAMMERRILVIDIDDPLHEGGTLLGEMDYEAFLRQGDPDFDWSLPEDEFGPIALNYTSGTTGNPKGVVTHHRGAYLNAMSQIVSWGMPAHSVYLWTLADVPLQRLVLSVGDGGQRRDQYLPAAGRREADLRCDPRTRRHPHVRGANHLQHADQCAA